MCLTPTKLRNSSKTWSSSRIIIIDASLYEDINRVSRNAICHYANHFDKIVTAMDEMKKGDFILGDFVFMRGD